MTDPKELGRLFVEERQKQDLSIEEACRQSRIHTSVIKDIEGGVFDRLGKTYVKSFLKKYSVFLGLDPEDIIKEYESISSEIPSREFDLSPLKEKEHKDILAELIGNCINRIKANDKLAIAVFVFAFFIIFILVFPGSRSSEKAKVARGKPAEKIGPVDQMRPVQGAQKTTGKSDEKAGSILQEQSKKDTSPDKRKKGSFSLTLVSRGDVWLQVMDGDNILFTGHLKEGDSHGWESRTPLTVWTGRADKLDFILNGHPIGAVAAGVVRDIVVSSKGIRIKDFWVIRLDR